MKITLEKVTRANYRAVLALKLAESQKLWVAPTWRSLVEAAYEPELHLLAVCRDATPVGLILYDLDAEMGGWCLSRFMIDADFQHQGLGKRALAAFLAFFDEKYPGRALYTSAELDNPVAQHLYETFDFQKRETFSYESDGMRFHEVKMERNPHD